MLHEVGMYLENPMPHLDQSFCAMTAAPKPMAASPSVQTSTISRMAHPARACISAQLSCMYVLPIAHVCACPGSIVMNVATELISFASLP